MTILLALVGSAVFGTADFIGGAASRHVPPVWMAMLGQAVALVLAVPLALIVTSHGVTATDAFWSLVGGVVAAVGLGFFYTAMGRGLISVVVPLTSVVGAAVPVTYGLGRGERPGSLAIAGIVIALIAVAIVSAIPGETAGPTLGLAPAPIAFSFAAGACFGTGLVFFSRVGTEAGLWPVVLSRSTTTLVLLCIAVALTGRPTGSLLNRTLLRAGLAVGVFEVGGNSAMFLALERGHVAIVSVLISLYPVTTVMLAAVILGERLSRVQLAGVALALASVVLISTG